MLWYHQSSLLFSWVGDICSITFYFPYLVPLPMGLSKARLNVLELEFTFSFRIAIKHPKQIFNLKP